MANRKRNIQMKFWVTEEEKRLIEEKMAQLHTKRIGAYLRKMAIDGYIIQVDTTNIKEMTRALSAIGRNINQIAKRVNAGGPAYQADMEEIRERDGADMAVTKTHPIKSTLKAAIDYICNPDRQMESCWCPPSAAPQRPPTLNLPGPATMLLTRVRTWAATSSRRLSLGRSHRRKPTGSAWSWRGRSWAASMSLSSPPT